jgi:hypothetical protein
VREIVIDTETTGLDPLDVHRTRAGHHDLDEGYGRMKARRVSLNITGLVKVEGACETRSCPRTRLKALHTSLLGPIFAAVVVPRVVRFARGSIGPSLNVLSQSRPRTQEIATPWTIRQGRPFSQSRLSNCRVTLLSGRNGSRI